MDKNLIPKPLANRHLHSVVHLLPVGGGQSSTIGIVGIVVRVRLPVEFAAAIHPDALADAVVSIVLLFAMRVDESARLELELHASIARRGKVRQRISYFSSCMNQ